MREPISLFDPEVLRGWIMPRACDLVEPHRPSFHAACAALTALLTGELGLTEAARVNGVCRKRLRNTARRAPMIAPDGELYGFRVCVPWGAYCASADGPTGETAMPKVAGPHAMGQMLRAQPALAARVDAFTTPLPPGRPPKAFDKLHSGMVAELKRLDLGSYYPLNQKDEGRRALLQHIRLRRITTGGIVIGDAPPPSKLESIFEGETFDRTELDGHKIDIEAVLGVQLLNGAVIKRAITTMWLIVQVETRSRAILGWVLRVGKAYNNLDVAECLARSLVPWQRRELTIPTLQYAPGAGLPSGVVTHMAGWRPRVVALDNALAHSAHDLEQAMAQAYGCMAIFGKAHQPRSRPIVEQLFSRLERGALRDVPGGFEPATRLGDNKIRISNFGPDDVPIQLHLFEELLEVIIANYNATPHPSLGDLSPLQYLQMHRPRAFDVVIDSGTTDADAMASTLVPLVVHGNRDKGIMPHVNYMYVRYRSPELDGKWELVGKTVLARVSRRDLRTLVLMRSATTPMCVVRAAAPWNMTAHDETTRSLIMRWSKLRVGLQINGADCAIAAYVAFLRGIASESSKAVDQLARMEHVHRGNLPSRAPPPETTLKVPKGGWVSFDDVMND